MVEQWSSSRGEGELSGSPDTGAGRVPYWHALRTHRLLIVGVTLIAVLVALVVVETATKRYDADADLGINPPATFNTAACSAADSGPLHATCRRLLGHRSCGRRLLLAALSRRFLPEPFLPGAGTARRQRVDQS